MDTEDVKRLVQKIAALLRKAKDSAVSREESEIFMAKAQELCTKHELDIAEVEMAGGKRFEEEYTYQNFDTGGGKYSPAQKYVTDILIRFFRINPVASSYFKMVNGRKVRNYVMILVGKKHDVQIATYVQEFLLDTFMCLWRDYNAVEKVGITFRNTFLGGLHKGLGDKLQSEKERAERQRWADLASQKGNPYALMVKEKYGLMTKADAEALKKATEDLIGKTRMSKTNYQYRQNDEIHRDGYEKGQEIEITPAVKDKEVIPESRRIGM